MGGSPTIEHPLHAERSQYRARNTRGEILHKSCFLGASRWHYHQSEALKSAEAVKREYTTSLVKTLRHAYANTRLAI